MTTTPARGPAAARAAAETDRQVRRLYRLAYRVHSIGNTLADPDATAGTVARATARIPRALSAAKRLLALPGVADHDETPYALGFVHAAERRLTDPATRLLTVANAARAAAARAAADGDDLRVVVFRDIEERSRHLVGAARGEPVSGRRGWTRQDRTASDTLQRQAAQWGLTAGTDGRPPGPAGPGHPPVPARLAREAADRAATRARCAPGIRCERPACPAYGALWVEHGGRRWFVCARCLPAENADLRARGFRPDAKPVPGGVPEGARFSVRLYNAAGRGARAVECGTAQEAQFIAETERPFNNTGYEISVRYASRPSARP
ncbi:hypothetical protein ABT269_39780 [Streptomyces viridosporus]|uniref:hypothetical protein n=1 Tax=Streptomyces viridosporus TaxID=67581 RepID=UPI00332B3D4D